MEAINFIKQTHKPFIGEIDNSFVDDNGFTYDDYYNIYVDSIISEIYKCKNKRVNVNCKFEKRDIVLKDKYINPKITKIELCNSIYINLTIDKDCKVKIIKTNGDLVVCNNADDIIARHIKMREGKGFITFEQFTDIEKAPVSDGDAVLLEDIGNLAANEMFTESGIVSPVEKVVNGIKLLSEKVDELIIVTNEVGCDGIEYAAGTMEYISAVSSINRSIAEFSDFVYECVYGIPVALKGE